MHKKFYASGFLYNPSARKILLRQQLDKYNSPLWCFFGKEKSNEKNPEQVFQKLIRKLLNIKINTKKIEPVYSYFHPALKKDHFVVYAEIDETKNFSSKNKALLSWFTFKQATKLPIDPQTKHDLVVSQRVIDAKIRKRLGEKTLE